MGVLLVGGGGREHALAWKLAQCAHVERMAAPGNPGIAAERLAASGRAVELLDIPATNLVTLADPAEAPSVDITVVGPDDPLGAGIVDVFWPGASGRGGRAALRTGWSLQGFRPRSDGALRVAGASCPGLHLTPRMPTVLCATLVVAARSKPTGWHWAKGSWCAGTSKQPRTLSTPCGSKGLMDMPDPGSWSEGCSRAWKCRCTLFAAAPTPSSKRKPGQAGLRTTLG